MWMRDILKEPCNHRLLFTDILKILPIMRSNVYHIYVPPKQLHIWEEICCTSFHLVYAPIGKSLFFHNLNCSCTIQELVIFCAYKSNNSCKKGTLQVSLHTLEVRLCRQTANEQRLNQKILGCILDTLQTLGSSHMSRSWMHFHPS
jgi:hypothetical protein